MNISYRNPVLRVCVWRWLGVYGLYMKFLMMLEMKSRLPAALKLQLIVVQKDSNAMLLVSKRRRSRGRLYIQNTIIT